MSDLRRIRSESFQQWRTPQVIFDELNREFDFDLDACADADNALCGSYFTAEQDAIRRFWDVAGEATSVFCNPPYSDPNLFLQKAYHEVYEAARVKSVVLLLPASVSTKWFKRACVKAEVHLFEGRIAFDLPPGMVNKKRPGFSNMLVIIQRDGLRGVTAFRSSKTGEVTTDLTDIK